MGGLPSVCRRQLVYFSCLLSICLCFARFSNHHLVDPQVYQTAACCFTTQSPAFLQGLPHSRLLVSQVYQATPGWNPQVYHTVACFLIGLQHSSLLFCQVYHTVACSFARFTNHHLVIAPGLPHSCLLFHKFTKGRLAILSVYTAFSVQHQWQDL